MVTLVSRTYSYVRSNKYTFSVNIMTYLHIHRGRYVHTNKNLKFFQSYKHARAMGFPSQYFGKSPKKLIIPIFFLPNLRRTNHSADHLDKFFLTYRHRKYFFGTFVSNHRREFQLADASRLTLSSMVFRSLLSFYLITRLCRCNNHANLIACWRTHTSKGTRIG